MSTPLLLVLALFLLILYFKYSRKAYEEFWRHLYAIPGPKLWPYLGDLNFFESSEALWKVDRKRSKEFYPIYKLWSLNVGMVHVFNPDDMELILSNSKYNQKSFFYSLLHDWLGTGLLTSSGEKWHRRRKILTPAFHFNILQEFTEMLNKETLLLVDNLKPMCSYPYVNVIKPITEFTLYSIGETALGVPLREDPKCNEYKQAVYDYGEHFIYRATRPWLYSPFIFKFSDIYNQYCKGVKALRDFSTNVIEQKKKLQNGMSYAQSKRLALLDLMLKAKADGADIDDDGIREELDTFIFEGHDTTSMSICYTLMLLANHKNIQEEIYEEIVSVIGPTESPTYKDLGDLKFMERCIKESLRLYPSVPTIGRVATENLETHTGYIIPKGCNVSLGIFDMHRSPQVWEDPEKFDPDRFLPDNVAKRHPFAYLPFSAGGRNCIGQKFALLEIKAVLCGILRNFKLEPYDRPEHLVFKADLVLRPFDEIRVKFEPR
ncbi:unnamed protein product [Phyllotreta striolata]|uniref:Cytochrome P450 monooxygenase n=1 Tax=Phyllotreta striolata TaxID=444603 RepID=A0A9N9TZ69_PHYSR|nr:unnamed protein product [Phyllotreta striolata]